MRTVWNIFRVSDHVFGVTDDSVPVGKLDKQCFECFPENNVTTETSTYGEDINRVIEKLLDKTSSSSIDVLLKHLALSREYSSDEDSFVPLSDDDCDLYY